MTLADALPTRREAGDVSTVPPSLVRRGVTLEQYRSHLRRSAVLRMERKRSCRTAVGRFMSKVDKTPTCWLWTGSTFSNGYGYFYPGPRESHRAALAHRWMYEAWHGIPLGPSDVVMHGCDVPACVNPSHLSAGTMSENTQDMLRKGRHLRGGRMATSRLTPDDARYIYGSKDSWTSLCARFGVSKSTIWRIQTGQVWGHATQEAA